MPSKEELRSALIQEIKSSAREEDLIKNPLAVWLENRIAIEDKEGILINESPLAFGDIIRFLSEDSGIEEPYAKSKCSPSCFG